MKTKILIAVLPLWFFSLAIACTPGRETALSTPIKQRPCTRRPIGFYQLPAELARVAGGCRGEALCTGGLQNVETLEIAGYAQQDWFWQGPTAATFSVAQQDNYQAQAQARAQAKRPATKGIVRVVFFTDIIAHSQGTQHFLGARATYANCVGPGGLPK